MLWMLCYLATATMWRGSLALTEGSSAPELSAEARLQGYLRQRLETYGRLSRPMVNSSQPVVVHFGFRLIKLTLDEKTHELTISVWCRYRWYDQYLKWKKSDFGGLSPVLYPASQVWTPDIALVNTAETEVQERLSDLSISYSGRIWWSPHRTYKSACLLDLTNYPYDEHACQLWFQSISHYDKDLQLIPYAINNGSAADLETYLSAFKDAGDWEITGNYSQKVDRPKDVGVTLMYSRRNALLFELRLRRRPGFTAKLLTIPPVVLACLSILVFCLPPERPDRHALATSVLGSFVVLLLILVEAAPPSSSSVPTLGVFYAFNIALVILSLFLSTMVVNISRQGDDGPQPLPGWVETVFVGFLGPVILLQQCPCPCPKPNDKTLSLDPGQEEAACTTSGDVRTQADDCNTDTQLNTSLLRIQNKLNRLESMIANIGPNMMLRRNTYKARWKYLARVLDRLFCIIYLIAIGVSLLCLFPQPA